MSAPTTPRYELRDAQPRWLALGVALLVLLVAAAFYVVRWFGGSVEQHRAAVEEPPHPMAQFRPSPTAAALQASPSAEYAEYESAQRALLSTYGWVDPAQGVVRVPIERAMELVLERGLPARDAAESER